MPFLLLVVLTLACLPDVRPDAGGWPEPTWIDSSRWVSALLSGAVLVLPVLLAWLLAWRLRLGLAYFPERRETILRRYERGRGLHQFALFGAYAVALCICGWGWLVGQLWHRGDGVPLPVPELLVLAPFLAALMLSWLCFFDAERACYRSSQNPSDSLADVLLDEGGLPPLLTTRWAYVGYQLRHRLALVCIPLSLLLLQKEAVRQFPGLGQEWFLGASLGGAVSLLALLIGMPWLLRLVLGLRPLPDSPLRSRLLAAARRLAFAVRTSCCGTQGTAWPTPWSSVCCPGRATSCSPTVCWTSSVPRRSRRSSATRSATSGIGTCRSTSASSAPA